MAKSTFIITVLSLGILLTPRAQAQPETNSGTRKKADVPEIVVTNLDISDKNLNLRYEIRNNSEQDIWICEFISRHMVFERYLAEDGHTLMLRRRLSVPMNVRRNQAIGRYLRLRSGKNRTESLLLPLPVNFRTEFAGWQRLPDLVYSKRLVIEIGYYVGDLPGMIFSTLEQAENSDTSPYVRPIRRAGRTVRDWLRGSSTFNEINEISKDRDEQVIIPWMNQALKGEQVLRIVINNLRVPFKWKMHLSERHPPDLTSCTRIEIHFEPSILEYFFPYAAQQNFLSPTETQYLRSLENIEASNTEHLKAFANEVSNGLNDGVVVEGSSAHVVCYRDGERLTSFIVYDDTLVETEDKHRFRYREGLQSLKMLTPQIQPFEYRVQCATNLKNLWHRLRLYHKAENVRLKESLGKSEMVYPSSLEWCDDMMKAYKSIGMLDKFIIRPHICPGADEGKSHYALNPNCKPDSPSDMILLFETKAGWNQHGGPELFTFDNHDPKGGCVLLNDGTVKFIRTKEELRHLRWK